MKNPKSEYRNPKQITNAKLQIQKGLVWNIDDLVKSRNPIEFVIPAEAGIQLSQDVLDPGFRRGDDPGDFLRDHQHWDFATFYVCLEFRAWNLGFPSTL
ncbi:MAG: hypothetical protein A2Z51_10305 [Deltaproteobacteria bacterium RBG_19FT_COMBO_52_11]|nr:MAG: hypothetical protein A2Z51_10305 [Deltaproteobacteria bacterium RBG_19FT_COMBO_52_11]